MRALVYHGPGQKAWEEVPDPEIPDDSDVIVRVDAVTICGTDLHILKGDVPAVHRAGSWATRRSAPSRRSATACAVARRRPGARLLHQRLRACRFCREGTLRAVPGGRRLGPRPQDRRHPGRVRPGAVRGHLHVPHPGRGERRGGPHAGRHPADRLRGRRAGRRRAPRRCRRRRRRRADRPVRDHRRPAVQPQPHRGHRPVRRQARGGQAVRRRRHRQQLARGPAQRHQGPDRAARRGRGHRGRRRARVLRAGRRAGPARRPDREHRRARRGRHAAPGRAVDQGHHDHHRPGGHLLHADPAAADHHRPDRRRPVHHPPLRPGRVRRGVRRVRAGRGHRRRSR